MRGNNASLEATDVSDDGTLVKEAVTDINFNNNLGVSDDGDGSVTVDATDTNTQLDDQPAEANVNMSNNNITAVDCVHFSNGAKWCGN